MERDVLIKKVNSKEECKICNQLLSELMQYEVQFDDTIVPKLNIENYYENCLGKDDSALFLAKCEQEPVGYVMAYKQQPKSITSKNFITIMNLYVREPYRKMGIGKLLVQEIEKWAKTLFISFILEIDCYVENNQAVEFYSKLDFKRIRVKMRKKV